MPKKFLKRLIYQLNHFMHRYPKKHLGQNFLVDQNILKKIASAIDLKNQQVFEIGAGQGQLTKYLVQTANQVVACEIDFRWINELETQFANQTNLTILKADFLKLDLKPYAQFVLLGNIPYNLSSPILFKIFENHHFFDQVILLVQKEFAQRLVSLPGQSDYGKLTLSTSLFYKATCLFDVEPKAFRPQPKVISTLVHLQRNPDAKSFAEQKELLLLIKNCFRMRRKTLWNNLRALNVSQAVFEAFCQKQNLPLQVRPEQLSLNDYLVLFECVKIKEVAKSF